MSAWAATAALVAGCALLAYVVACWTLHTLRTRTALHRTAAGRILVAVAVTASYIVGAGVAIVIAWTADALSR